MAADSSPPDDPRLDDDHVRTLDAGRITLVGVVHDHPASRYRVHELVGHCQPDVLALETPPLALPLFEQYAADTIEIPETGGEMSAAIAAVGDAQVVGIDGIDGRFLRTLLSNLRAADASLSTVRSLAAGVTSVSRHALACRLAATLGKLTGYDIDADRPVTHDCTLADSPAEQAADERAQLSPSLTLLRVADPPTPVKLRDDTREACMAQRIEAVGPDRTVVAVVGRGHLDPLAEKLSE